MSEIIQVCLTIAVWAILSVVIKMYITHRGRHNGHSTGNIHNGYDVNDDLSNRG